MKNTPGECLKIKQIKQPREFHKAHKKLEHNRLSHQLQTKDNRLSKKIKNNRLLNKAKNRLNRLSKAIIDYHNL